MMLCVLLLLARAAALRLPASAISAIHAGRVAVLENWLPADEVAALRADAAALHRGGSFSENSSTDLRDNRAVLRLGEWNDAALGDGGARARFGARMAALRATLADALGRPRLRAAVPHEISFPTGVDVENGKKTPARARAGTRGTARARRSRATSTSTTRSSRGSPGGARPVGGP